jgi:trehalose/maltose transport system permease protein
MRRSGIGGRLLLAPCILVVVVVIGYPLVHGLSLSFLGASLLGRPRDWVGLANYSALLKEDEFWQAARTTIVFTIASAGISFVLGVAVAMALNRRFLGRTLMATLLLLPWVFPAVVTATIFKLMVSPGIGVIDQLATAIGLIDRSILIDERALLVSAIAADVWRATPFVALLALTALRTVPEALHDSARTDGAGALRRAFHITLPLLRPVLLVILLLRILDALRVYDLFWVMSGRQLNSLSSFVFENVLRSELGVPMGAAAAVVLVLVVIALAGLFLMLGAGRATGAEEVGGAGEPVARHRFSGPFPRVAFLHPRYRSGDDCDPPTPLGGEGQRRSDARTP